MLGIIGGHSFEITEAPWQAYLEVKHGHGYRAILDACSGSIIHEKWILTTAHCVRFDLFMNPILNTFRAEHSAKLTLGQYNTQKRFNEHIIIFFRLVSHSLLLHRFVSIVYDVGKCVKLLQK